eukprot:12412630-Karenia_brevis.AAC.1
MKYYHSFVVAFMRSIEYSSIHDARLNGELLIAIDGSGGAKLKDGSGDTGLGGTLSDAAKSFPLPVHDSFHAEAVAFA